MHLQVQIVRSKKKIFFLIFNFSISVLLSFGYLCQVALTVCLVPAPDIAEVSHKEDCTGTTWTACIWMTPPHITAFPCAMLGFGGFGWWAASPG